MSEDETVPKLAFIKKGQQVKKLEAENRTLKARLTVLRTNFPVLAGELESYFAFDVSKEAAEILSLANEMTALLGAVEGG